ncbi:MAG: hypothetical protein JZD41_02265 [Thermoproteus sp.]|nr:hypothetical protein [Thermoproteus sp.]
MIEIYDIKSFDGLDPLASIISSRFDFAVLRYALGHGICVDPERCSFSDKDLLSIVLNQNKEAKKLMDNAYPVTFDGVGIYFIHDNWKIVANAYYEQNKIIGKLPYKLSSICINKLNTKLYDVVFGRAYLDKYYGVFVSVVNCKLVKAVSFSFYRKFPNLDDYFNTFIEDVSTQILKKSLILDY